MLFEWNAIGKANVSFILIISCIQLFDLIKIRNFKFKVGPSEIIVINKWDSLKITYIIELKTQWYPKLKQKGNIQFEITLNITDSTV